MESENYLQGPRERLQEHICRVLAEHLSESSLDWTALDTLKEPVLRIEACLEEHRAEAVPQSTPGLLLSQVIDLSKVALEDFPAIPSSTVPTSSEVQANPVSQHNTGVVPEVIQSTAQSGPLHSLTGHTPTSILPTPPNLPISNNYDESNGNDDEDDDDEDDDDEDDDEDDDDGSSDDYSSEKNNTPDKPLSLLPNTHRQGVGGLRLARSDNTPLRTGLGNHRKIQTGDSFSKRRKLKSTGHFLKSSTLDKLVTGIWEQIHGDIKLDPWKLLESSKIQPASQANNATGASKLGLIPAPYATGQNSPSGDNGRVSFRQNNALCRQVTQTARACRSLEVIVQAQWVELFEKHVDSRVAADQAASRTKHNKVALLDACADFGWSEKELRNKMYVWRGYKEIKDAGGWAALVFSGIGIYRFCKYRIGFDNGSMERLRDIRPALEVAADTLHPNWRQLLSVVGASTQRLYDGHPHDWVVRFDGSDPVPLATTYYKWDPHFTYRQLDEPVIDHTAWDCDDPRWMPPSVAIMGGTALPSCDACGQAQSDEPNQNNCYCFPSIFGCAKTSPSPVMIFHTPDGRNNGLIALCAFERGAAVGEFVGVVTKGLEDVDVMECSTALEKYQVWQGREGNFTRFVNHSCKANAQYQRFAWMNTQRIVLVSKGIEAGCEITVDYSEKYWKGLDKHCLCGESCCRYRVH